MVTEVPEDFQFAFKVTNEIAIKKFPNCPASDFGPDD